MASPRSHRPARTLVIFGLTLVVLYGLVALAGSWKPNLGLDLQGGTRITMIATGDNVTKENLDEAAGIIDNRVNGSGVSEAEVMVQGNKFIVVEIPGESRRDLVETVVRQAQLRFRLVANVGQGAGTQQPGGTPVPEVPATPDPQSGDGTDGANRAPYTRDKAGNDTLRATTAPTAADQPTDQPSDQTGQPTDQPSEPTTQAPDPSIDDPLTWMRNPDPASVQQYNQFTCPDAGESVNVTDNPDLPLVTCDEDGQKYLLSKAIIEGTQLESADAQQPQGQIQWVVTMQFDNAGAKSFSEVSQSMAGTDERFAVVLDGTVISSPVFNQPINDGRAEIEGDFNEESAGALATSLKYGALPIAFEKDPSVETVGPSLAGNQLSAGITAGVAGLLLVMLYCLFYYRGLGIVVLASLVVAGVATYALVMLLSETAGFTLTLPGIAGLIVAVGITADSFIVFFERIRDEMRDGKTMRVAVEAGWLRARNTCLAADAVSLLAAIVLYIFAAGVVKGFAFALGLSTLIDLAVFFWFTKPMVSLLAKRRFFNAGHRLSGLDAGALGIAKLATEPTTGPTGRRTAGGKA